MTAALPQAAAKGAVQTGRIYFKPTPASGFFDADL
jgi:hypothetical protein